MIKDIHIEENLLLTPISERFASELFTLTDNNREYLKEWLPWLDHTTKREDTVQFIRGTLHNPGVNYHILYESRVVGMVGQNTYSQANKFASLGYWLSKDHMGKGIMTKAVKALIQFSFDEMGVETVEIQAAVENKASRAIPERLGFTNEGILRQREWLYDHFVDHVCYSLLKSEWKP